MPYTTEGTPARLRMFAIRMPAGPRVACVLLEVDRGGDPDRQGDRGDEPDQDQRPDEPLPDARALGQARRVAGDEAPIPWSKGPARPRSACSPTGPAGWPAPAAGSRAGRSGTASRRGAACGRVSARFDGGPGVGLGDERHQYLLLHAAHEPLGDHVEQERERRTAAARRSTGNRTRSPSPGPDPIRSRARRSRRSSSARRPSGLRVRSALPVAPAAIATTIVSPTARENPRISEATMPETAAGNTTRRRDRHAPGADPVRTPREARWGPRASRPRPPRPPAGS